MTSQRPIFDGREAEYVRYADHRVAREFTDSQQRLDRPDDGPADDNSV
jgi:hypothetical protein